MAKPGIDIESMQANAGEVAALLKMLSNRNRLLVLCALVTRDHTAGELEALTGLSQPAISQHLAKLRNTHIVTTRKDAQRVIYSLEEPNVRILIETLHAIYCPDL